jgi:hypothetical protein
MLEHIDVREENSYEIAVIFGENINKLLTNSAFPTFLNLFKNDYKMELIDSISEFIETSIF